MKHVAVLVLMLLVATGIRAVATDPLTPNRSVESTGGLLGVFPDEETGHKRLIDELQEGFRKWSAQEEPTQSPSECLRESTAAPLGHWAWNSLDSTSVISILRKGGGLSVRVASEGHVASYSMIRNATERRGLVQFDGPVSLYDPFTFSRVSIVRVGGTPYLVPSIWVEGLNQAVAERGCSGISYQNVGGLLFRKLKPEELDKSPFDDLVQR